MISKDAKKEYDRARYLTIKKPERFGEKRCAACEIYLRSKFGGHYSRRFCIACKRIGTAQKITSMEKYLRKVLPRRFTKEAIEKRVLTQIKNKHAWRQNYPV